MKITGTGQVGGANRTKKSGGSGGADFSKFLGGADEASEAAPAGGIRSIAAVSFIQEVEESDENGKKKRELVNKGNEVLDKLEEIRDSMLFGTISIGRLQNLQNIISNIENSNSDPKLEEIIEQIKTRAAVELAKLGF